MRLFWVPLEHGKAIDFINKKTTLIEVRSRFEEETGRKDIKLSGYSIDELRLTVFMIEGEKDRNIGAEKALRCLGLYDYLEEFTGIRGLESLKIYGPAIFTGAVDWGSKYDHDRDCNNFKFPSSAFFTVKGMLCFFKGDSKKALPPIDPEVVAILSPFLDPATPGPKNYCIPLWKNDVRFQDYDDMLVEGIFENCGFDQERLDREEKGKPKPKKMKPYVQN